MTRNDPSPSEVSSLVDLEMSEGVAHLTLSNPGKRNVLSLKMLAELSARLEDLSGDPSIKVVIIAAEGSVFSSGHDLKEVVGVEQSAVLALFDTSSKVMEQIRAMPKAVIAQVEGLATAAGCQLVASCDLVVASENARFQTPGMMIGLFCSTPMVPLSRAVPSKKALEMLFTGRPVDAMEAERMGLVNRVVPLEDLSKETMALARDIAQYSGDTLAIGKEAYYRQMPLPLHEAYQVGKEAMTRNALREDAQEGMSAFLEKRPPQFKH